MNCIYEYFVVNKNGEIIVDSTDKSTALSYFSHKSGKIIERVQVFYVVSDTGRSGLDCIKQN